MSTNYIPSDQRGNWFSNGTLGFLMTFLIFGILPAMHILGNIDGGGPNVLTDDASLQPPPPPPEDLPPPPEDQEDLDKPDVEEPPPPMTLAQLELALNPGSGNAMGDFGFNDFNANINAANDMRIFDIGDLDEPPRPIFQVEPRYPYAMQQAHIDGWTDLEWIIDPKGGVMRARATRSSHREFEQPAIDSIMRSKWKPGKKDGKAVLTRVRQRMLFRAD